MSRRPRVDPDGVIISEVGREGLIFDLVYLAILLRCPAGDDSATIGGRIFHERRSGKDHLLDDRRQ